MKRRMAITALVALITLAPALTLAVGLQQIVPKDCNQAGGCQSICDLAQLAQNALDDGIFVAIFLSAILFAWAGWRMVVGSSTGNMSEREAAKKIFFNVMVGLVLIISAWLIVSVIMSVLTNNSNWNSLCGQSTALAAPAFLG